MSGYIGVQPIPTATRSVKPYAFTAPFDTVEVVGGYVVNNIDVHVNGLYIEPTAYTATNGTQIVFSEELAASVEEPTVVSVTEVRQFVVPNSDVEAVAGKLAERGGVGSDDENTFEIGEPQKPTHPALSGNTNTVLTAQTLAAQVNELTEPNNAGAKNALNASGDAPIYACRAWVNFNGNTLAIRGSGNVSSVGRPTTGRFQINFTTNMEDTNYSTNGTCGFDGAPNPRVVLNLSEAAGSTTIEVQQAGGSSSGNRDNQSRINVQVMR